MPFEEIFGAAQIFGYLSFLLGIVTFWQKDDRYFKLLLTLQCLTYVVHFWLLGHPAAAASAGVAALRSLTATRTNSRAVCAFFVVLGLAAGGLVLESWIGVLPVVASAVGTVSIFLLREIRLRLGMLFCTLLWLVHNVLTGSLGGTLLELAIAATNLFTLYRLASERRAAG